MKQGVKFGVIYGVVVSVLMLVLYLVNKEYVVSAGLNLVLTLVIGTAILIMTGRAAKVDNGGFLPFGEAFVSLLVCFAVGSFITTIFTLVLYNMIDPSLQDLLKEKQIEMAEFLANLFGGSVNEDQLDEMREALDETDVSSFSTMIVNWLTGTLMGAVYCLIIAAFVKKNPTL
jgi:hypothetical protein